MAGTLGAGLLGMGGGAVIGGSIVRLFLDTKEFDAALAKTKGETVAAGSGMQKFGMLATAAYAAAAYAAVKFAVSSVKAYQESQAANAQTVAVLKSTGEAAGMTYDAILNLAKGFQQTTTYSDEAVQSAENLILTFKAIGSDIFPQTTQAVLDMSTALGQDLKSSAIQLGKALQDPTIGLTALRRVGVAFSVDQVTLIKHLVATNDLLGAQKIILAEVGQEFGGSAAAAAGTYAGKIEQLKNRFNDLQEQVGHLLIDAMGPLMVVLGGLLTAVVALEGPLLVALGVFVAFKIVQTVSAAMMFFGQAAVFAGTAAEGAAASVGSAGLAISGMAGPIGIAVAALGLITLGFMNAKASADKLAAAIPDGVAAWQRSLGLGQISIVEFNQKMADMRDAAALVGVPLDKLRQNAMPGLILALNHGTLTAAQFTHQATLLGANAGYISRILSGELNPALDGVGKAAGDAGREVKTFAALGGQSLHDFRQTTLTSLKQSEQSFSTFAVGWKHTAGNLLNQMDRMKEGAKIVARDLAEITPDLAQTANGRSFLAFLQTQGPSAIDKYAGYSKAKQQQILGDWKSSNASIQQSTNTLASNIGKAIGAIPDKTVNVTLNVTPNVGALSSLIDQRIGAAISGLKTGG